MPWNSSPVNPLWDLKKKRKEKKKEKPYAQFFFKFYSAIASNRLMIVKITCPPPRYHPSSSTYLTSVGKFILVGQKASKVAFVLLNKCH